MNADRAAEEESFRRIRPNFQITIRSQENYKRTIEGLGKICAEFQHLESLLKLSIPILIAPKDLRLGRIVAAQLSFNATLDLFYALYHHRFQDPTELEELGEILKECAQIEERRNRMIHSRWTLDSETGKGAIRIKHTAKGRKEYKTQRETLLPADMEKFAGEIQNLRDRFIQNWIQRVHRYELRAE